MKVKHLIVLSMLAAMGCNSAHEKTYTSFDDYPVYEGEWEEMNAEFNLQMQQNSD